MVRIITYYGFQFVCHNFQKRVLEKLYENSEQLYKKKSHYQEKITVILELFENITGIF